MRKSERYFRNGILQVNRLSMIKKIAEAVKDNTIKKAEGLTAEQVINVYEETEEMRAINDKVRTLTHFSF